MNDGRQMGVHYMDGGGFPYAVNENFVDFFQGINHVPVNYAFPGSMPDQVFLFSCNFLFLFLFVFQFSYCLMLVVVVTWFN